MTPMHYSRVAEAADCTGEHNEWNLVMTRRSQHQGRASAGAGRFYNAQVHGGL